MAHTVHGLGPDWPLGTLGGGGRRAVHRMSVRCGSCVPATGVAVGVFRRGDTVREHILSEPPGTASMVCVCAVPYCARTQLRLYTCLCPRMPHHMRAYKHERTCPQTHMHAHKDTRTASHLCRETHMQSVNGLRVTKTSLAVHTDRLLVWRVSADNPSLSRAKSTIGIPTSTCDTKA